MPTSLRSLRRSRLVWRGSGFGGISMTRTLPAGKVGIFFVALVAAIVGAGIGTQAASPQGNGTGSGSRNAAMVVKKVAIVSDLTMDAPAKHGVAKLEEALRARGVT